MELEYLSTVTGTGLEKQEIVVQLSTKAKDFLMSKAPRPAVKPPPPSISAQCLMGNKSSSLAVKRLKHKADHSPPPKAVRSLQTYH